MPTQTKHSEKKCKTCKYRAARQELNGCDYILIAGHSRGCPVKECDKYEEGKRVEPSWYMRNEIEGECNGQKTE